ncbi:hypothetical protein BpHYR1_015141 [Brachionus plicatilis]|uniref:Uncharacterized protein n=1 Tax=Brachionus plicatilis TaxID=10195 RepID=A0A3M7T6L9_BRAPC|nr:hypothetical protein BpHYR1_015141 [Brachionus plicatilis]
MNSNSDRITLLTHIFCCHLVYNKIIYFVPKNSSSQRQTYSSNLFTQVAPFMQEELLQLLK